MARDFDDASSEYLEIDSAPISGHPCTLACWFYLDDQDSDHAFMYIGDKDVNDDWFQLRYDQSSDELRFGVRDVGETNSVSTITPASGEWVHIAGAATSATVRKILVNGGDKGTSAVARSPNNLDRISIGRMGDSTPSKYMDGRIAEVAVWNTDLTDIEIGILAKGFSPLFIRPQNLVFYAPLIRDEDLDRVGGLSLTAFNTPTVGEHTRVFYPAPVLVLPTAAGPPPVGTAGPLINAQRLKSLVNSGLVA